MEAIVKHISLSVDLNLSQEEVEECDGDKEKAIKLTIKKIIRNLDYRFKKNHSERLKMLQLLEASPQLQAREIEQLQLPKIQQQVLSVLLELQLNVSSVAANDLPMLTLPPDLIKAIRANELPCRHALAIAKLSSNNLKKTEEEAGLQRQQVVEKTVPFTSKSSL